MAVPRVASNIEVPFPDTTMPGLRPQESGGRLINCYVEPLGAGAPSALIRRRAPGLRRFGTTLRTGFRGAMEAQGQLFAAFANNLVSFGPGGGSALGVGIVNGFTGTAKGFFARNNKTPTPDMVFVDPDGTQIAFTAAGAFTSIYTPTSDQPTPNSVCVVDGFFVFTSGDGHIIATDLNSLTVNPLSFARAESKPDALLRGVPWAGNLFLFGTATTEVWANAGTTPFPFQRSVVIPRGLAGPYCVAGFEDNFSRALVWVADDNTVVKLNGYAPEKISPPDLDALIEDVTDKRQLEMSVYMSRGHAFIILSSIKQPATAPWPEWTWVFDLNNNKWAERDSYLRSRSRITGGVFAFGSRWLCGDIASGNVHEITDQVQTEVNPNPALAPQPLRWRVESGAVENFPVGARVGRFDGVFVTGVGLSTVSRTQNISGIASSTGAVGGRIRVTVPNTSLSRNGDAVIVAGVGGTIEANGTWPITVVSPGVIELNGSTFTNAYTSGGTLTELAPLDPIETDPVVEVSWSDDGGATFSAPIIRRLGRQSQTRQLVSLIACTGRSSWNGRRWRLDIADPVHVGFMGAYQNTNSKVTDIG